MVPNFGGNKDNLNWDFDPGISSDDISDFSETEERNSNSKSKMSKSPRRGKKKINRKIKAKRRKAANPSVKTSKKIEFYKRKSTVSNGTSLPNVSDATPRRGHLSKGRKKNMKLKSRTKSRNKIYSSSFDNEGGSVLNQERKLDSDEFWEPSQTAVGKMNYFKSNKGREEFKSSAFPYKGNSYSQSLSPDRSGSFSGNFGYRNCIISPREQDIDYIAKQQDNNAFYRNYKKSQKS